MSILAGRDKTHGEVFTRRWVVDLILDLADYTSDKPLHKLTAVEPALGHGAFLGPMLDRLIEAWRRHDGIDWFLLTDAIRGFDIQPGNVATCRELAVQKLTRAGCTQRVAEDLAATWITTADFLLSEHTLPADLVVGNPPYVRIENLRPAVLAAYRHTAPTMGGRADIFVGFYEHGLDLLKPGGKLAFICADRWMRNAYGRGLRRKIVTGGFSVDDVIVMHDADAFEAVVSAYPAITVISRRAQSTAVAVTANAAFTAEQAERLLYWRGSDGESVTELGFEAAKLESWHATDEIWPDGSPAIQAWLESLESLPLLENKADGTKLGIGVATGADRVYVRRDPLPDVEKDRLLPMVTSGDVKSGFFEWTGQHLINPWGRDGVVSLTEYPKLGSYYIAAGDSLTKRNVAARSGRAWYRTIDRVNHGLLERDMLVMEDMKAEAHPVRVPAGFYPHHNLYWVVSDAWDLDSLGGLLLSKVVEKQVAAYCVKMRGGTLRFQATVLRKVRAPRPRDISGGVHRALADAFKTRDREAATEAALRAYGMAHLP